MLDETLAKLATNILRSNAIRARVFDAKFLMGIMQFWCLAARSGLREPAGWGKPERRQESRIRLIPAGGSHQNGLTWRSSPAVPQMGRSGSVRWSGRSIVKRVWS